MLQPVHGFCPVAFNVSDDVNPVDYQGNAVDYDQHPKPYPVRVVCRNIAQPHSKEGEHWEPKHMPEAKKAWDPMTYIPGVVREGSSWGRKPLENRDECFLRESQQLAWKADIYGQVLEEVYLSPKEQSVLFLGRAEFLRDDGSSVQAGHHQPLFHVEHAVNGTESHPENLWRIVHLTSKRDDILLEGHLAQTGAPEWLQKFVAIYVERDLEISLTRR